MTELPIAVPKITPIARYVILDNGRRTCPNPLGWSSRCLNSNPSQLQAVLMPGFRLLCATGFVATPYDRTPRKPPPWAMSYCPKCGKTLEHDRRSHTGVCTTCGTAVMMPSKSTGVASFTRPEASGRLGDNFCLRCGQRIRGNAKFCSSCSQVRSQEIPTIY